jgi:hypothetical protein
MSIVKGNHAGLGGAGAPGGPLSGGGGDFAYPTTINQSLRFDGSAAYLSKNDFGTSTDVNKRTFSTWIKQSKVRFATYDSIICAAASGIEGIIFEDTEKIGLIENSSTYFSNALFRDPTAWYHVFFTFDHSAGEYKLYINGSLEKGVSGATTSTMDKLINTGHLTTIMKRSNASQYIDGYLAETVALDGYIGDINDFAEDINGVWVPKNLSSAGFTYGVNGFYFTYKSSDINTTGSSRDDPYGSATDQPNNTIADNSGQGNHFTINGITANDVVPDTPTNNFYTMNPNMRPETATSSSTYPEGAIGYKNSSGSYQNGGYSSAAIPVSGKWYFEVYVKTKGGSPGIGFQTIDRSIFSSYRGYFDYSGPGSYSNQIPLYNSTGKIYYGPTSGGKNEVTGQDTWTTGDIIQVFVNVDDNEVYFGKNNTWQNSADPDALTGGLSMGLANPSAGRVVHAMALAYSSGEYLFNFGQDDTFADNKTTGSAEASDANGVGDFYYTPPTDALALCTSNLPTPAIGPNQDAGLQVDDHFETILYTGTGGEQHIGSGGVQHPQDVTTIANSLRFEPDDEPALSKSDFSTQTNTKKMTISVWVKRAGLGARTNIIFAKSGSSAFLQFDSSDKITWNAYNTGYTSFTSDREFKNTSAWYHIVAQADSQDQTGANIHKVYVNGELISGTTSGSFVPDDTATMLLRNGVTTYIGDDTDGAYHFDGYLAEMNVIDGSIVDPTEFGQLGSNGYWIPKAVSGLTFGDNGFYLDFSDNSTASALGTDSSGKGNDFTPSVNIETTDQMGDSPTQNFDTWDPNNNYNYNAPTEGNLRALTSGNNGTQRSTFAVSSGKWYWEARNGSAGSGSMVRLIGIAKKDTTISSIPYNNSDCYLYYDQGNIYNGGDQGSYGDSWSADGDIVGVAFDADNGALWFSKNGTWQNSATASEIADGTTTNAAFTGIEGTYLMMVSKTGGTSSNDPHHANFGQDPTFAGDETAPATDKTDANGLGKFFYDVPTGFLALVDDNIPKEGIDSPDFVWIKERDANVHHYLFDTIRGPKTYVQSSVAHSTSEATRTDDTTLISFDPQGFTIGSNGDVNGSGDSYVAWMWKAGGPSPTRNYTVKVDADASDGDQNKYLFDGNTTIYAPTLTLQPGGTYTFDQSDSSNTGHPLRFSTTSDGTHGGGSEYTTGVTTAGTPGTDGTTTIVLASDAPTLYYYCSSHSGMGGQVTPNTKRGSSNFKGGKESIVTANQTAGFSIASYVGDHTSAGLSGRPVGHGLLKQTEFTLIKDRGNNSNNDNWSLSSTHIGDDYIYWTSMNPTGTAQVYPTSGNDETVTVGISGTTAATRTNNEDNHNFIMYNFHSVDGYCKLGSYEGNGIAEGPFVYTGFKPRWVMIKCYEGTGNWFILDSVRSPINEMDDRLDADNYNDEDTSNADIDFLSNGFQIRTASTAGINQNNNGHFYIAFAECPFKYSNSN